MGLNPCRHIIVRPVENPCKPIPLIRRMTRLWQSKQEALGGSVKRSLAMAFLGCDATIAKAYGLDAATRPDCHFFVVHP